MQLKKRFSDADLEKIIETATFYLCACPAQVAVQLRQLRELIRYQKQCRQDPKNDTSVHLIIEQTSIQAHQLMEECMDQILTIEGWDRQTLVMPEGLRHRRDEQILEDD